MDSNQSRTRVRIFVDFWNFHLSLPNQFRLDWRKLPHSLVWCAADLVGDGANATYEGMGVYLSHNPKKEQDGRLVEWASNVLDRMPGTQVVIVERRATKHHPKCPACHLPVETCPSCKNDMRGTHEKGVDTRIVTDMIRLAWEQAYDVAVLATSDADFVPAVEFLGGKNVKVVHAGFGGGGHHLAKACWGSIDVNRLLPELERPPAAKRSPRKSAK